MTKAVIISAVRTAIGNFGGRLKNVSAVGLGSAVIAEAIKRAKVKPNQIDDVVMGNVIQAGLGQNPARQASLRAGVAVETPAVTINRVCGSGLEAVNLAAQSIEAGNNKLVVAGGMENMSQSPFLLKEARWGYRLGDNCVIDALVQDGLWDIFNNCHMGILGEKIADKYDILRVEQDRFAFESQQKTKKASEENKFEEEIIPIEIPQEKGEPIIFKVDEFPKPETTIEKLAKLKPAFKDDGTITAGNASGINDAAAAVVLCSEHMANRLKVRPLAVVKGYACVGVEPAMMGLGPVPVTRKVLEKTGLAIKDLDLIEVNEAFAAQTIAVCRELGLDKKRVNVNGGAIALGHPIGASGARMLVTLLYEMERVNARYGLTTLCIGGGQGISTVVERTD